MEWGCDVCSSARPTVDSEESTRALCCNDGGWSGDDEGENCEALAVGGGAEGARGFIGVGVGGCGSWRESMGDAEGNGIDC